MIGYFDLIVNFGIPLLVFIVAYFIGNALEKRNVQVSNVVQKLNAFDTPSHSGLQ